MRARNLAVILAVALALTACTLPNKPIEPPASTGQPSPAALIPASLGDPALLSHIKDTVETDLVDAVDDQDAVVENVEAIYYSKEYLGEVAFNSKPNIYFGYTLAELENQFEGQKYVFAPDGQGKTIAKPFEEYDDTYDQIVRNVMIGSGVILLVATVAVAATAAAPEAILTVIVVTSAKSALAFAGSDALLSAIVAAVITGVQTGDIEQALEDAGLAGSEGILWGAIAGTLLGGWGALSWLRGATKAGLTMAQAARAQRSGIPLSVAKRIRNGDELRIYQNAALKGQCKLGGKKKHLLRQLDLTRLDGDRLTNLQRMQRGMPPLDPDGVAYELHHIGQQRDSPLAVLTAFEHRSEGNNKILHPSRVSDVDHGPAWDKQKKAFWKDVARLYGDPPKLPRCLS